MKNFFGNRRCLNNVRRLNHTGVIQGKGLNLFGSRKHIEQRSNSGIFPNLMKNNDTKMGKLNDNGSIFSSFKDPDAISFFLTNSQNALEKAKQFAPTIQQYAPLVRNLPALLALYKGMQANDEKGIHEKTINSTETSKNKKANTNVPLLYI
ncbi:hypothetical protein H4O14_18220 [Bacillus sp. PAMC26568]|nr:hypothetical protein H4O14_18220 [Bacillus sp. PAMC26568]